MEKFLFQEYPAQDRAQMLEDNADGVEILSYLKEFDHEELKKIKDELIESLIKISELNEELALIKSEFKEKIEPHSTLIREHQEKIKMRAESVKGRCYKLIDHSAKMVGYYDPTGKLVYERPATSEEAQGTILSINRAVNL